MAFMRCFDAVEMVTDLATERFAPLWKEDRRRKELLKLCCDEIDTFAPAFNADTYDVEVDEDMLTITVSMECDDVVLDASSRAFYDVANRALAVRFSVSQDRPDKLVLSFVFLCIWTHV